MTEIIHKEISFAVNGCIFDVHNNVGPGDREESYQKDYDLPKPRRHRIPSPRPQMSA